MNATPGQKRQGISLSFLLYKGMNWYKTIFSNRTPFEKNNPEMVASIIEDYQNEACLLEKKSKNC